MRDYPTLHFDTKSSKGTACSKKGCGCKYTCETIQHYTLTKVKVKEQCFYCFSTFHSHRRVFTFKFNYTPLPEGGWGYTVLPLSVLPSVQDIFRRIFLSNCWWQKSDIWSQASYKYTILWVAFLDPSDSYFLFADLSGFYTHWTYMHIFRHIFLSNHWWQKSDICHKLHIGTPYRGKRFRAHQIPTSCLPT
jgi:hypothetical protein